jgi:hypothetical protein
VYTSLQTSVSTYRDQKPASQTRPVTIDPADQRGTGLTLAEIRQIVLDIIG